MDIDFDADEDARVEDAFRTALRAGRFEDARALAEVGATDAATPGWQVASMLEDIGLSLAGRARYDEAISAFERALELGWDVVPDGRCEIALVLLLAGRHAEADAQWAALAGQIHPAIVAEAWRSAGRHPSRRDVAWAVAHFLRPAESVGLLARAPGTTRHSRGHLVLTAAGRVGLTTGLRARALSPAADPY